MYTVRGVCVYTVRGARVFMDAGAGWVRPRWVYRADGMALSPPRSALDSASNVVGVNPKTVVCCCAS